MAKIKIEVVEKLEYVRRLEFDVPGDMDQAELETILNDAEAEGNVEEFILELEQNGIFLLNPYVIDMRNPADVELECTDYEIVEEDEGASA